MKTCTLCKQNKALEEFANRSRNKDGKMSWCKPCKRDYDNNHYKSSPDRRNYIASNTMKRRDDNRARVMEYLSIHPCVDCGETDPVVLEFDHRRDKTSNVSRMLDRNNWDAISAEIAKCDVRCANCHRRKTARDFGWYKLVDEAGI